MRHTKFQSKQSTCGYSGTWKRWLLKRKGFSRRCEIAHHDTPSYMKMPHCFHQSQKQLLCSNSSYTSLCPNVNKQKLVKCIKHVCSQIFIPLSTWWVCAQRGKSFLNTGWKRHHRSDKYPEAAVYAWGKLEEITPTAHMVKLLPPSQLPHGVSVQWFKDPQIPFPQRQKKQAQMHPEVPPTTFILSFILTLNPLSSIPHSVTSLLPFSSPFIILFCF